MARRWIAAALSVSLAVGAAGQETACPEGILGDWVGSYVCPHGQGLTGLTLTVTSVSGPAIAATFNFYGPSVVSVIPSGSYTLAGTYDGTTGAFHLDPVAWIKQPPAYSMIGMEGVFDAAAGTAKGRVDTGCADFQLSRRCAGNEPIVYDRPRSSPSASADGAPLNPIATT